MAADPDTIYHKVAASEIPAMRLGGKGSAIRIDTAELKRQVQRG